MEHIRLLLAIVLTIMVFVLWEVLFVPTQAPDSPSGPDRAEKSEPAGTAGPRQVEDRKSDRKAEPEAVSAESGKAGPGPVPAKSFKTITVENDLYRAEISEKGAAITRFVLNEYNAEAGPDAPPQELISEANKTGTVLVRPSAPRFPDLSGAVYTTDFDRSRLRVWGAPESLSFYLQTDSGLVIEKQYVFHPDSYRVTLNVSLINQSESPIGSGLLVDMTNPPPDGSRFVFEGPFAYIDQELEEIDVDDIEDQSVYPGKVRWTGLEDRYFMTALVPREPASTEIRLHKNQDEKLVRVTYLQPGDSLAPGQRRAHAFELFMGPKRMSELKAFGHDLDEAINFGFFDIIAKPCLWLMNRVHDNVFANYGVAIILVTLLFKIIFWPLGSKSYRSMAEMKKLQPLMSEIRQKYKDDKKKMNEEIMRLYRTYKVNPMSGCLPMVVQIPVFIAFYRMLYEAIELRHAPFLLWINDLSAPDRLFRFDVTIPFMTPPYGIPVLTIIMGATMFLQQKLSPPPGDPSQAKFMMMMPLIFTVIFINFPSGLVLYWLTNNVLSIAQQYYITRKIV